MVDCVNTVAVEAVSALDRLVRGQAAEQLPGTALEDLIRGAPTSPAPDTGLEKLLQEVKQSMNSAINALVDTAAQTGMRRWGKFVGGGSSKKEKGPIDLDTLVARLRTSLPVMRAA